MPFGMVSGIGREMGVLYRPSGGYRRRERAVLGVNLGRSIVTNGDFATRLIPDYFGQDLLTAATENRVPFDRATLHRAGSRPRVQQKGLRLGSC